uniref:PPM-type phosphatase domain-containing protein n=1 Tax=Kalanchoe fedtschenkoi TaxID=63787 RepID=A0A7N0UEQ2_KALFE
MSAFTTAMAAPRLRGSLLAGFSPFSIVRFSTEQGGLSAEVIKKAFDATEEEFLDLVKESWSERPGIAAVGSCCLVGAISKGVLYVANLGDSRAVLGRRVSEGRSSTVVAERLSTDHNVAVEEVRKEVEALHPDDSHVVVFTRGVWRIKGIIQVSRSIGDVYLKKPEYNKSPLLRQIAPFFSLKNAVMTAEPSILIRKLLPQDLFVIFASDGLWEHLSDEDAVGIVLKSTRAGVAKRLVRAALQQAAKKREIKYNDIKRVERGCRRHIHDDITVIVMYLDHPTQAPPSAGNSKSFADYTSAPTDIFSLNSEEGEMSALSP